MTQYRKVVKVSKKDLLLFKKVFSAFGTKTDCERKEGITRQSITRVLLNERGEERIVKSIRKYCKKQ